MLIAGMPNVAMLNAIMLSVIMLSAVVFSPSPHRKTYEECLNKPPSTVIWIYLKD
jgi:hypothetical protein